MGVWKTKNKTIGLALLICLWANVALAQVDYRVYANIIYRFTKYINWPDYKKSGDFIIGVVGETPLYEELQSLTQNKRVGSQAIVVRRISSNDKSFNAHIIFIADEEAGSLKRIAQATAGKAILLVSEHHGFISRGACINFITIGDNLKLEFGKTNIERRDLNIASELLNLGVVVN